MLKTNSPKRILIAPLDWGLGHATRCIPIINELKKRKCEIFIASSGKALILLRGEFPDLVFFEIASYQVHYSKRLSFFFSLLFQVPKFIQVIKKEHRQIERIVKENKIDIVISDNRFGCHTKLAHSVFITHQVNLLMPAFFRWLEPVINYCNRRLIKKFDQCWIPDESQKPITGKMSSSDKIKLVYIGLLSRMTMTKIATNKFALLVLLSGPEPQRTVLEKEILKQLPGLRLNTLIVRGLPGKEASLPFVAEHIVVKNYLNTQELNQAIEESDLVLCRSGYSTIMDLIALEKKAVFIPTPGQTEQEYLAQTLADRRVAFYTPQHKLNIAEAIKSSSGFTGFKNEKSGDLMSDALDKLLA